MTRPIPPCAVKLSSTVKGISRVTVRLVVFIVALLWCLPGAPAASAADLSLKTQLLWGTDQERPQDSTYKEVDAKLKKKLSRVFKWRYYYEINEQKVTLGAKDTKRLKLSAKCEIEVRFVDENTLEIKLFGEGRWAKTVRQSVRALNQGELAVLAGDDKEKYDDAWFVVLSANPPRADP
jgi:hypothetical protein